MKTPILIRAGATIEFALIVAGSTGWFPQYLPLAGNAAVEATVVIGTSVVLHEIVELVREVVGRRGD